MTGNFSDLKADADNDGNVNAMDAVEILKAMARVKDPKNNHSSILDVNGDGIVNVNDAVEILKQIANVN